MIDNFDACLAIILKSEGGFVDDASDPGGATNLGVTLNTLSGYLGRSATVADVKALTPATVAPLYKTHFWNAVGGDELPAGVDLMTFDAGVNMGPGTSVKFLQQAAGVRACDGIMGPDTLGSVEARDPSTLIDKMAAVRIAYYKSLPTFPRFGDGWLNRVNATVADAKGMIT